jgi:hypothetical protein
MTTATNMSVKRCEFPEYHSGQPFKIQTEPTKKYGYTLINKDVYSLDKFDKSFVKIVPKNNNGNCADTSYFSRDPRLYHAASATWIQLDRPPTVSTLKLNTLHNNPTLDGYGKYYKSYSDINAGQISYYVDKQREDAFYEPLFFTPQTSVSTVYQDPMGSLKPQYNRIRPNKCDSDNVDDGTLSWIKDSQYHREDLLALKMRKHNQERYVPRWTNTS